MAELAPSFLRIYGIERIPQRIDVSQGFNSHPIPSCRRVRWPAISRTPCTMSNGTATQTGLFKSNVGGLLVGVNIQAIVFGLASLVTIAYFRLHRKSDGKWIRLLIMVVWSLCGFCTAIDLYSMYYFLVITLTMPAEQIWAPWSLSLLIAIVAIVSTIVRLLLLHRLAKFHQRKGELSAGLVSVIVLVALLSFVGIAGGIGITVRLLLPNDSAVGRLKAIFDALLVCAIAADVSFVFVQSYSLHRSRSGLRRTDSVINLLILYTISTGLIPTAFALATLVSMFVEPQSLLYAPLYMQVGNLYLITLVASLNHRKSVLKRMSRPLELNYSAFGRLLSDPRGDTEPIAPATAMDIPELGYADAPSTAGFAEIPPLSKSGIQKYPSSRPLSTLTEETAGQGSHAVSELLGTESRQAIEPGRVYEILPMSLDPLYRDVSRHDELPA